MKRFALCAISVFISLTLSMLVGASTVSKWQVFWTLKAKGFEKEFVGPLRLESDGTVSLRDCGSIGTWSRTGNELILNPDKSTIGNLLNSDKFNGWVSEMGRSSGSITINTINATGKFLSDSMIQGLVRANIKATVNGEVSKDIRVSIEFMGMLCKNGTISGKVSAPNCGCVEARNLATNEIYDVGCVFGGGSYGDIDEKGWCEGVPSGNYEVCLRNFCGSDICKSGITVGGSEDVTVNFP